MKKPIVYAGYGHNTDQNEFLKRIPNAQLMGTGVAFKWRFELQHYSNIIVSPKDHCYCVLWQVPADQLHKLDLDEDYKQHYKHRWISVHYNHHKIQALTYTMESHYRDTQAPSIQYIRWIETGYRQNNIPIGQLTHALSKRIQDLSNNK